MEKLKKLWKIVAIVTVILFTIILVSSSLSIGERLRKISFYLEIAFYVIVVILVYFGIFRNIFIILKSPSFQIVTTVEDKDDPRVRKVFKNVAKNIVKNNELPEKDRLLLESYKDYAELRMNLTVVFHDHVKKQLNAIIIKNSRTCLISTAISQSARFDMITVYAVNITMIRQLVEKCGFRPNTTNISKLFIKVFGTALIADGLENLNFDEVFPTSFSNAIGEIPLLKPVMKSVTSATVNALLTLRIGMVTRKYLFRDGNEMTREDIRRSAYKESALLIPQIVGDTLTFLPKKFVRLFKKKDTKTSTNEAF